MLVPFLRLVVRWRIAILLSASLWAIFGFAIARRTPIDVLPDLSENQILVYTPWHTHRPQEIDSSITQPLSKSLAGMAGLRTIRGSSEMGFSLIHCIFDDRLRFDEARRQVAERLQQLELELPADVHPQLAPEGIPTGQIVWYGLTGDGTDLVELRRWQDEFIAPQLSSLPGVAEVSSVGGMRIEVELRLDSEAVARTGLSLQDLEEQLRSIPAGLLARGPLEPTSRASLDTCQQLEDFSISTSTGQSWRLEELGHVSMQPTPRDGVFEMEGSESVAGIVHLAAGENPLEVTQAVLAKMRSLNDGLPPHIRMSTCYERTALIEGAIATLKRTVIEAILITTLGIWLIMRHVRTSLVIGITVPLAVLGAFLGMGLLTFAGSTLNINIMSLAGIAVSIGVLVDSSIVIVDNITHRLKTQFGDQPVTGDISEHVVQATALVAKPAVFAILIMLVSFLPIFSLDGIDGKMYRPLAWTKTMTLISVIILSLTLVPSLASFLIRGRLRSEEESAVLRAVSRVYRPCLLHLLDNPWPVVMMLGMVIIAAASMIGNDWMLRSTTLFTVGALWWMMSGRWPKAIATLAIVVFALTLQTNIQPISMALRLPLDEGMVMDMPITTPRMTVLQAVDDLKARNMILCRFPEVQMVTGKVGRAETAFDPAPIDMIETMVEFRPKEFWPRRRLLRADARSHAELVYHDLVAAGLIESLNDAGPLLAEVVNAGLDRFNSVQREFCWQLLQSFEKRLAKDLTRELVDRLAVHWVHAGELPKPIEPWTLQEWVAAVPYADQLGIVQHLDLLALRNVERHVRRFELSDQTLRDSGAMIGRSHAIESMPEAELKRVLADLKRQVDQRRKEFIAFENQLLYSRVGRTWTQIVIGELCQRVSISDNEFAIVWEQIENARYGVGAPEASHHATGHVGMPSVSKLPIIDPHPKFQAMVASLAQRLSERVWLWPHSDATISGSAGELNASLQMPGWANVWTRPIQNRIDMLASGVNSEVGIRVLGDDLRQVVETSERIAEVIRQIPGASNVLCDPVREKDYIDWIIDSEHVQKLGIETEDVNAAAEAAIDGRILANDTRDFDSIPLRLVLAPPHGASALDAVVPFVVRDLASSELPSSSCVPLRELITVRHRDGPSTIKSENGQLRTYVRLNVRGQDAEAWVVAAKPTIAGLSMPRGVHIEWTGQYAHAARTRLAMAWIVPGCIALIWLLLLWTFRDPMDAVLMLLSVPGALAGGVVLQWLLGFPFSLAVAVGYISCFGMAAATSMLMLVYLRQALADAGGLEALTLEQLKQTVVRGAVQRLRPKLLTEAALILGLAPLMWSSGIGADIIRPMAAPVIGGILIADEVVDLLVPILFYWTRKRRWSRLGSSLLVEGDK